ncbi:MAG: cupredoxin domain-containing protein [Candidatus Campbellbacteria bacterium]|nr:cupredoxin domain-containing protein [Candidatus Campbellbacteria bacterium]
MNGKSILIIVLLLAVVGIIWLAASGDEQDGDNDQDNEEQVETNGETDEDPESEGSNDDSEVEGEQNGEDETSVDDEEGEEETVITFTDNGFDPEEVTVSVGESVVWVNESSEGMWPASNVHPTHEIYSEFDALGEIPPGEGWEFTFEEAGDWGFHDHLSPQFEGVVHVTE